MRAHDVVKRTQHIWPGMNVVNEATEEMSALCDQVTDHLAKRLRSVDEQLHDLTARNLRYLYMPRDSGSALRR
jgi:hypothetical protein